MADKIYYVSTVRESLEDLEFCDTKDEADYLASMKDNPYRHYKSFECTQAQALNKIYELVKATRRLI